MTENKARQICPHCRQASGVEMIYGSVDALSEALRNAAKNGDVALGGTYRKWDWEEELINTRCLHCKHEWHGQHKNLWHKHPSIHTESISTAEMAF